MAAGRNQYSQRRSGSLVNVSIEVGFAADLARLASGERRRADGAILTAHNAMARRAQLEIRQALVEKLQQRGRDQRRSEYLLEAIMEEDNRRVNLRGWTVGYLGENSKVALYYRNLEIGTDVFVGRAIEGSFQDSGGRLMPATSDREAQIDPRFLQFSSQDKHGNQTFTTGRDGEQVERHPHTIFIQHAIAPYRYFETGLSEFEAIGVAGILEFYIEAFGSESAFYERLFRRLPQLQGLSSGSRNATIASLISTRST